MNVWLLLIGALDCIVGLGAGYAFWHRPDEAAVASNLAHQLRELHEPDALGFRPGSAAQWRKSCVEAQQQTIDARRETVRVMEQRDEYRVDADKWKQVHAMWLRMKLTGDGAADFGELMGILANDAEEDELIDG